MTMTLADYIAMADYGLQCAEARYRGGDVEGAKKILEDVKKEIELADERIKAKS